jgi:hypothetical protein
MKNMKRINFKQIKTEVNIGEYREMDFTKEVGNVLFRAAQSLEQDAFSRKVHAADGEIEVTEEELSFLQEAINGALVFRARKAILDSITEL